FYGLVQPGRAVGQERPALGRLGHGGGQFLPGGHAPFRQKGDGLGHGEALRHGDGVQGYVAGSQFVYDLLQGKTGTQGVLPGLQPAVQVLKADQHAKNQGILDEPVFVEQFCDAAAVGAGGNGDQLLLPAAGGHGLQVGLVPVKAGAEKNKSDRQQRPSDGQGQPPAPLLSPETPLPHDLSHGPGYSRRRPSSEKDPSSSSTSSKSSSSSSSSSKSSRSSSSSRSSHSSSCSSSSS